MSHLKIVFIITVATLIGVAGFVYVKYSGLQTDYQDLTSRYTSLQSSYTSLQSDYTSLQSNYTNVSNEVSSLSSDVNSLQSEINSLQSSLQQAQSQIDIVKARVSPTYAQRETYITPNDSAVTSRVIALGGTLGQWNWDVAKKCLDWVAANIEYAYDPNVPNPWDYGATTKCEWWRKPSETISEGKGDCEDQATLLCSMLRAIGGTGSYCLRVASPVADEPGHVFVITRVDGQNAAIWDSCAGWWDTVSVEVTCEHCGGAGKVNCSNCNGTGKINCSAIFGCGGSGTCWWCGGDGIRAGMTCSYCGGSGRCSYCSGTGKEDCWWCSGTGKRTCWYCGGSGKTTSYESVYRGYYGYGYYSDAWNEYKTSWKQWIPSYVFRDGYYTTFNSETEFLNWLKT